MTRLCPWPARKVARIRPRPRPAPVTRATPFIQGSSVLVSQENDRHSRRRRPDVSSQRSRPEPFGRARSQLCRLPSSSQPPQVLDSCALGSRTLTVLLDGLRPCSLRDRGVLLVGGRARPGSRLSLD